MSKKYEGPSMMEELWEYVKMIVFVVVIVFIINNVLLINCKNSVRVYGKNDYDRRQGFWKSSGLYDKRPGTF